MRSDAPLVQLEHGSNRTCCLDSLKSEGGGHAVAQSYGSIKKMLSKVVRGEVLESTAGGRIPAMGRQPVPSMGPLLLATAVPEHVVPGGHSAVCAGEGETVLVHVTETAKPASRRVKPSAVPERA